MKAKVRAVNLGKVGALHQDVQSAIAKRPVRDTVQVGWTGLAGDEQADPVHHGGRDKAIHHYARDHYPVWHALLGDHPVLQGDGAFGENISTIGMTETNVFLGDRFRLGTALVEVSHGRQPCFKLNHRFANPGVLAEVVRTARCGWYYRVIETGAVTVGDKIELVERPLPDWSVARCFALLIGGGHKADPAGVRALAQQPLLADAWRERAATLSA